MSEFLQRRKEQLREEVRLRQQPRNNRPSSCAARLTRQTVNREFDPKVGGYGAEVRLVCSTCNLSGSGSSFTESNPKSSGEALDGAKNKARDLRPCHQTYGLLAPRCPF